MLPREVFISINNDECSIMMPYEYNDKIKPSDAKMLIPLIEKYISENTDESIAQENYENMVRIKSQHREIEKEKVSRAGYVYLIACADKHKIGYSKNVEQRMKQLDTRPFPLKLVAKVYSEIAFDIEQSIHKKLQKYKADGEWYKFGEDIEPKDFEEAVRAIEYKLEGDI